MDGFTKSPRIFSLSITAGILLVLCLWMCLYCAVAISHWLPAGLEGEEMVVTGHLLDFPRSSERGWQFDFHAEELGGKIRLSIYDHNGIDTPPAFDCRYRFAVKLRQPRGLLNFGQYDYQGWLLQAGYRATGYVRTVQACDPYQPDTILQWRAAIAEWIRNAPLSERASSTLLGLLIGSYADIDVQQWQVLRDSGTIHLLSVSGLHIVMVAMLAYRLSSGFFRLLVLPLRILPATHWGGIAALVFAILYALLAGFSVATQRSLLMVMVAVLQQFLYGRFRFGTGLLVSLVLVFLLNPLSVLSAGFWFSFIATALLLLSHHGFVAMRKPSLSVLLMMALRLQWLLFLLMAPVLMYVYGRVPFLSLPLNLLAVPWVSFISLPAGFAALLCKPLSSTLATWLLQFSGWTLDIYWQAMQWGVGFGQNWQWSMGGISLPALMLALAGLYLLAMAPPGLPLRFAGVMLCLPMLFPRGTALTGGEVEVTFADVGQGLAVIVRTANHVLVYDTGDRASERFDAGRDIVAPALRNLRIGHVDMLMVTHADSDHAGGTGGLLQEYTVRQLWSGTPEQLVDFPRFLPCRAGMHWRWDGVDFRVLHPGELPSAGDNNRGCVLMLETTGRRVLLTADIEQLAEQMLSASGKDLRADVMLSPHHGSKTSSSPALLSAVQPSLAIASAGYRNRFHHPARVVVDRYGNRGIRLLNTADTGAIRLQLSEAGIREQLAVCQQPVPWRLGRYREYCGN